MNKAIFTRNFLTILAILTCMWGYHNFTWLALPEKTTAGRYDSYFLLNILACCSCLALYWRGKIRVFFLFVWMFCIFLIPLVWWNYTFYRDGLVWSSLLYGADVMQGSKAIGALGHVSEAVIGSFILILGMLATLYWLPDPAKRQKFWLAWLLVFFFASFLYGIKYKNSRLDMPLVPDSHPVLAFFRSALAGEPEVGKEHIEAIKKIYNKNSVPNENFPLYSSPSQVSDEAGNKKNVILVVLESVRASETGVYADKPYTPNLDRIAKQSLVVSDFYANGTQTVRGEMSLLCGVLDLARGAPFSSYGNPVKNRCLPEILRDYGYETHWFHGYEKSFFKRNKFLPSVGFSHIHDRDQVLKARPDAEMIGWGVADESVFDYTLKTLEKEKQPFFAEIMTLSNHYPFDWDWNSLDWPAGKRLAKSNDTLVNYHNGIRYTDFALGRFWDAFSRSSLSKNTALFIVADHGIWLFDEADNSSPFLKNEKYYRVPLLMALPNKQPDELDMVASQVDLPPSILSYLDIQTPTAFWGKDIFTESVKSRSAVLVKNGSFGFRSDGLYCYPNMADCNKNTSDRTNENCRAQKSIGEVECVSTDGQDMLLLDSENSFIQVDSDVSAVRKVIEYMNIAHLRKGFFPEPAAIELGGPNRLMRTDQAH